MFWLFPSISHQKANINSLLQIWKWFRHDLSLYQGMHSMPRAKTASNTSLQIAVVQCPKEICRYS